MGITFLCCIGGPPGFESCFPGNHVELASTGEMFQTYGDIPVQESPRLATLQCPGEFIKLNYVSKLNWSSVAGV